MHYGDMKWNEVRKGGNVRTPLADPFCHTAETNMALKSIYAAWPR